MANDLPHGWRECTVADICAATNGAIAIGPFGSRMKSDCYVRQGIPVIRGNNLAGSKGFTGDFVYISDQKAKELGHSNVYKDDLVFPHRGAIGEVGLVAGGRDSHYVLSTSLMKLTVDKQVADPLYLFYYFRSRFGRYELLKNASQVGTPGIATPLTSLKAARVLLPTLAEQRAIADILGSLDDKMELNRRMNQTLEAMARAIFKSWFIDFDPVRAKADGCTPPGLDPATAALFPDTFQDSPLGPIPQGWQPGTLGDVVTILDSKRIPMSSRERAERRGQYPYYGAAGILDHVDDYLFEGVHVLMGEDGSVIDGEDHPIVQYVWGQFWVNNHAHVLNGANGVSDEQLYLFLKNVIIRPYVTGAVQPKLNQRNMKAIPFVAPTEQLGDAFAQLVAPIFARLRANHEESATLATARDVLLPRLLSGELSISESVLEEIAS